MHGERPLCLLDEKTTCVASHLNVSAMNSGNNNNNNNREEEKNVIYMYIIPWRHCNARTTAFVGEKWSDQSREEEEEEEEEEEKQSEAVAAAAT